MFLNGYTVFDKATFKHDVQTAVVLRQPPHDLRQFVQFFKVSRFDMDALAYRLEAGKIMLSPVGTGGLGVTFINKS